MFCAECGTDVGEDGGFCPSCGAALADPRPGAAPRRRLTRRRLLAAGAIAIVLVGAGAVFISMVLGDAPEDNAVELVPADAALYATAYLEPSLGQKRAAKNVLELARDAGVGDGSGESLEDAVGALVTGSTEIDYREDVKPTAGDQMAVYARAGEVPTVLLATEDPAASRRAMHRMLEREFSAGYYRLLRDSHRGQRYEHVVYREFGDSPSGATAFTVLDGFVVVGGEEGVLASIDASQGSSLADSERFSEARATASDDVLAFAYFDGEPLERAGREAPYTTEDEQTSLELLAGIGPVAATVGADDDRVELELTAPGSDGQAAALRDPAALLATLPAEAVAAISLGDLRGPLRRLLDRSDSLAYDLREAVSDLAELDADADLATWLGALGFYVAGIGSDDVEIAAVAETRSAPDSDRALDQIEGYYSSEYEYDFYDDYLYGSEDGLGFDVYSDNDVWQVRGDEDRVVAGIGAGGFSTDRALDAQGGFGETDLYRGAAGLLGGYEPFLAIDVPATQRLYEDLTEASFDEDYVEDVRGWISAVSLLAGGVRHDGDELHVRLVAQLDGG